VSGQGQETREVLRDSKRLLVLALTATLLSVNWGLFIYGGLSARWWKQVLAIFLIHS
jgi:EamA domain-containing membrane protein RarD